MRVGIIDLLTDVPLEDRSHGSTAVAAKMVVEFELL